MQIYFTISLQQALRIGEKVTVNISALGRLVNFVKKIYILLHGLELYNNYCKLVVFATGSFINT